jgi:hypothetical protein
MCQYECISREGKITCRVSHKATQNDVPRWVSVNTKQDYKPAYISGDVYPAKGK